MVAVLLMAGHAYAEPVAATYVQWERLRNPDTVGISFAEGTRFLAEHADWPEIKLIRLRTEAAALLERPARAVMAAFCAESPPISGRGMVACAQAQAGSVATNQAWVKQGWIQGDFSENEEDQIRDAYGALLTHADHVARTDRLLYEGKVTPAKRMLPLVSERRALYETRIAFITGDKRAPAQLARLAASQQRDGGLLLDRIRWRAAHDMDDQLAELFALAPKTVPYPDLWWPMRAMAVRNAINQQNYKQASALLANHGALKGEYLADALWMKGWIGLQRHGDAGAAYQHFYELYTAVYTPVSKARAAYWAARAAIANGNDDIARDWMGKAARHPTVFYGQLAHAWLKKKAPLPLPAMPGFTAAEKSAFDRDDLVQIARQLAAQGDNKGRDAFLNALALRATTAAQFALVADLATDLGGTAAGVEVAKQALRNAIVMLPVGWPRIAVPANVGIEPALTLAITRQESEFDPRARSSADARGLMQLLPATAKHVADKHDIPFSPSMIENPNVNMTLGSTYLGQLIRGFDGSYILGIASYNAGPGSVRRWIATMGRPPANLHGAIDWVESIPYGETRNYVMRVLENVTIYRTLADPKAEVELESDLVR